MLTPSRACLVIPKGVRNNYRTRIIIVLVAQYVKNFWMYAFSETRGGQLGQEKRQWKFPRTGERARGMLLLTNQFHDSSECLSVIGHKNIGDQHLSRCFHDLLIRRSLPANLTVCCTCDSSLLPHAVQPSSRRAFSENEPSKAQDWYNFLTTQYIYYAYSNFMLFRTNSWFEQSGNMHA